MSKEFIRTQEAAIRLGMSEQTLRRWVTRENTPFVSGVHYLPKTSSTGNYSWNVQAIRKAFLETGNKVMAAEVILRRMREAEKYDELAEV